jgi:hypothetical protein
MPRAPELGDECRPGGSCPECNAVTHCCALCDDQEVEAEGDVCGDCMAKSDDDYADEP